MTTGVGIGAMRNRLTNNHTNKSIATGNLLSTDEEKIPTTTLPLHDGGGNPTSTSLSSSTKIPKTTSTRHTYPYLVGTYCLRALALVVLILIFGSTYSAMTTTDPCIVLQAWKQQIVSPPHSNSSSSRSSGRKSIPQLLHIQSKMDTISEETQTWMTLLNIQQTEVYPNIVMDHNNENNNNNSNPAWKRIYWSDDACEALVEHAFPDFYHTTYRRFPHPIQKVDACRYVILYTYGGIYADSDISLHITEPPLLLSVIPYGIGLVESPYRYNEKIQNSLMTASTPHHPFWEQVITTIQRRHVDHTHTSILSTTGPKVVSDVMDRYQQQSTKSHPARDDDDDTGAVHILPCELFQRVPVGQWDTTFANILGRELLSRAIPMKGCGTYGNNQCEITRHVGKASWTQGASGKLI